MSAKQPNVQDLTGNRGGSGAEPGLDMSKISSFYVEDWLVDSGANRLRRGEQEEKLEARVMDVLVYLAGRPGELVTRESLEKEVWSGRVVSYESLTSSITKLRKAFGDSPRNPRFIETVSKKGYRLIGRVSAADSGAAVGESQSIATHKSHKTLAFGVFLLLVLAVVLSQWMVSEPQEETMQQADDRTSLPVSVGAQSLVVLPFVDISSESSKRYLGDGITEDLTTALSRISGFFVIARSSAMNYKGQAVDVKRVAAQLGVNYVVEGSVQRESRNIRINVKLIDGKTGFNLWAQQYDREVSDIFEVQDAITQKIVDALEVKLTEEEKRRTAQRYTVSFDAYDTFLQGQVHYFHHTKDENAKAREMYYHAIELDPQFARAMSAIALTYTAAYRYGWASDQQAALQSAQNHAEKAVSIDNQLPQAHWVLGYVYLQQRKYDQAIQSARQAIRLNPNFADGFATLGVSYIYAGDPQNGMSMMQHAMRLNPQYPAPYASALGQAYYFLERYDDAITVLRLAIERNNNLLTSHVYYIASLSRLGKTDDASWAAVQMKSINPAFALDDVADMFPIKDKDSLEKIKADLKNAGLK